MAPTVDQEFVAHLFAFEDGPSADRAYEQLTSLWEACRDRLGMTAPIAQLRVGDRLPRHRQELPDDNFLAAQETAGTPNRQAVLRRTGGLLNLSVMLKQPLPDRTRAQRFRSNGTGSGRLGWIQFMQLWSGAAHGGTDALLSETVLLLAKTPTRQSRSDQAISRFGRSLTDLLPHDETRESNWWDNGLVAESGFAVWDTKRATTGARELVVVAAPSADRELSRWAWFDPEALLPPLAEYLLEAAALQLHTQVLNAWSSAPRFTDLDEIVEEVNATFGPRHLPRVSDRLRSYWNRLQVDERRLKTVNERLQRIIDQTGVTVDRMPRIWGDSGSLLPRDRSVADWIVYQASAEQAHQRSKLASITYARQLVGDELTRSIQTMDSSRTTTVKEPSSVTPPEDVARRIFVVHGRDDRVRETFFSFLQALDLRPQDWELLVRATGGTTPNMVDIVRHAPDIAQATLVLMTPDDTVQLHPDLAGPRDPRQETEVSCQPRPNVLLELGMALMAYPDRTIVIEIGALRPVADLAGMNVIRFDGSGAAIAKVISRLRAAGCPVDDSDTSWKNTSKFDGLAAFTRKPRRIE